MSNDEFGPDTETIRAWLNKRATYAKDARVVGSPRGSATATDPSPPAPPARWTDVPLTDSIPASPAPAGPDSVDAGRSVLAALGVDQPTDAAEVAPSDTQPTEAEATAEAAAEAGPVPHTPQSFRDATAPRPRPARVAVPPQVKVGRWTEPEDNLTVTDASTDADFPARAGVRRALSLVLVAVLAATGAASYLAWQDGTTTTLGIAATLGLLSLVVWAARAGCTTTHLAIHRGQLSVRRNGHTELVELASGYTPIAIVGEPGERRWRVHIERVGLPLLTITPAMVDPHWFTTALYRLRPDLRPASPRDQVAIQ